MSTSQIHIMRKAHTGQYTSGRKQGERQSTVPQAQSAARFQPQIPTGSGKMDDTTKHAILESIREANESVQYMQKSLHFRVHEGSGQLIVEVEDMRTGEILREVPPEEMLDTMVKIKTAIGALIDKEG